MKQRTAKYMQERKLLKVLGRALLKHYFGYMEIVRAPNYPSGTGSHLKENQFTGFEVKLASPEVLTTLPVIAPSE